MSKPIEYVTPIPAGAICGYIGDDAKEVFVDVLKRSGHLVMVTPVEAQGSVIRFQAEDWLPGRLVEPFKRPVGALCDDEAKSAILDSIKIIFFGMAYKCGWCPDTPWVIFDINGLVDQSD